MGDYLDKKKTDKKPEPEEESKNVVTPEVTVDHDDKMFYIDVELPGVAKENVDLSVGEQSICVEASRDDTVYMSCFSLAHTVDESKARAKYENGLLRIEIPFKALLKAKRIQIE